jgi:transposase InsO family protein
VREVCRGHGISEKTSFIDPGKPVQNAFAESFNSWLRDECLNAMWFWTLAEARSTVEEWRVEYNEARPHSGLAGVPPRCSRGSTRRSTPTRAAGRNGWSSVGGSRH